MIIILQIIVIFVAISLLLFALGSGGTHAGRAWKKLILCFLAIAMAVAVIFPDTTNKVAHIVGVGRGADLLLYILTLVFIGYVLNNYLHQQNEKDALYRLARKVALIDANKRYKIKG